jgi:hypothetical protein
MLAAAEDHVQNGKEKGSREEVKVARENGFDNDLTGIDDCLVFQEILPYMGGPYKTQMEIWRG